MSGVYNKVKFLTIPYGREEIDMDNLEKYSGTDISNFLTGKITCIKGGTNKEYLCLAELENYIYGERMRTFNLTGDSLLRNMGFPDGSKAFGKIMVILISKLDDYSKSNLIFVPPDTSSSPSAPVIIRWKKIDKFIIDNFNGKITQKNDVWCPGTFITEDKSMSENLNFNRLATEIMVNGFGYPEDTKIYGPMIFGNNTRFIRNKK